MDNDSINSDISIATGVLKKSAFPNKKKSRFNFIKFKKRKGANRSTMSILTVQSSQTDYSKKKVLKLKNKKKKKSLFGGKRGKYRKDKVNPDGIVFIDRPLTSDDSSEDLLRQAKYINKNPEPLSPKQVKDLRAKTGANIKDLLNDNSRQTLTDEEQTPRTKLRIGLHPYQRIEQEKQKAKEMKRLKEEEHYKYAKYYEEQEEYNSDEDDSIYGDLLASDEEFEIKAEAYRKKNGERKKSKYLENLEKSPFETLMAQKKKRNLLFSWGMKKRTLSRSQSVTDSIEDEDSDEEYAKAIKKKLTLASTKSEGTTVLTKKRNETKGIFGRVSNKFIRPKRIETKEKHFKLPTKPKVASVKLTKKEKLQETMKRMSISIQRKRMNHKKRHKSLKNNRFVKHDSIPKVPKVWVLRYNRSQKKYVFFNKKTKEKVSKMPNDYIGAIWVSRFEHKLNRKVWDNIQTGETRDCKRCPSIVASEIST